LFVVIRKSHVIFLNELSCYSLHHVKELGFRPSGTWCADRSQRRTTRLGVQKCSIFFYPASAGQKYFKTFFNYFCNTLKMSKICPNLFANFFCKGFICPSSMPDRALISTKSTIGILTGIYSYMCDTMYLLSELFYIYPSSLKYSITCIFNSASCLSIPPCGRARFRI